MEQIKNIQSDRLDPEEHGVARLSAVIPALDAARSLGATLQSLEPARTRGLLAEVLVVDGGSRDGTAALAETWGARVLWAPRGRGSQLAAGAAAAAGGWLLFLHADTRLAPGWEGEAEAFMDETGGERAGAFRLRFEDAAPAARRLERLVAWRSRRLGLPYGDQGLLISRALYDGAGGFRPLPLMEDVDLARRLGRRRMALLRAEAVTSAARYRRRGYWRRSARNLCCLALFYAGMPPRIIARIYG